MSQAMPMNTHEPRAFGLESEARNQFLTFHLRGELFAMDVRSVKEVIQCQGITEVPLMSAAIRGVINLRGAVVPVVDLSVRFGWSTTELARRTCVVILQLEQAEGSATLGILVDHVSEVLDIAKADIEPAPAFGSNLRPDFIGGIGKVGSKFIIILDVNQVLSIQELASLDREEAGARV